MLALYLLPTTLLTYNTSWTHEFAAALPDRLQKEKKSDKTPEKTPVSSRISNVDASNFSLHRMKITSPFKTAAISTGLAVIAILAGVTNGQNSTTCLSLKGSTECPSFQDAYINPTNLSTPWPWFSLVTDVTTFDEQFALYFTAPDRFIATKFINELQCNQTAVYNTTLQWERTILCGQFTQISWSASCNVANNADPIMVCQGESCRHDVKRQGAHLLTIITALTLSL